MPFVFCPIRIEAISQSGQGLMLCEYLNLISCMSKCTSCIKEVNKPSELLLVPVNCIVIHSIYSCCQSTQTISNGNAIRLIKYWWNLIFLTHQRCWANCCRSLDYISEIKSKTTEALVSHIKLRIISWKKDDSILLLCRGRAMVLPLEKMLFRINIIIRTRW